MHTLARTEPLFESDIKAVCTRVLAGKRQGSGFLVSPKWVITCNHVVVGLDDSSFVRCRFGDDNSTELAARVIRRDPAWDIALLELAVPINHLQPLPLAHDDAPSGRWYSYGFPSFATGSGVPLTGEIMDPSAIDTDGRPAITLYSEMLVGPAIDLGGFSGSPIVSDRIVIGMLFRVLGTPHDRRNAHLGISYAVPTRALRAATGIDDDGRPADSRPARIQPLQKRLRALQERKRTEAALSRREGRLTKVGLAPRDLPPELFKDRTQEQSDIKQLISGDTARVVTIIGRAGIGKTALACRVLKSLENRSSNTNNDASVRGIVYMSTRTSGIALEQLLAECLRVLPGRRASLLQRAWAQPTLPLERKIALLLESMSDGRYVILLDNIEDALDSNGRLSSSLLDLERFLDIALRHEHGARIIITTREPITIDSTSSAWAERKILLSDGIPVDEGVLLLRQLDQAEIGLKNAPTDVLARIVTSVLGIPRALELVVSYLAHYRVSGPTQLLVMLEEIAQGAHSDQVLKRLIEDTYRRVSEPILKVLETVAAFKRPVDVVGLEYVLDDISPELEVAETTRRAVNTLLITRAPDTALVFLHPADRDYLYSRIPETGEYCKRRLHSRIAEYYQTQRVVGDLEWRYIRELDPQLNEIDHLILAEHYDLAAARLRALANRMSWLGFPVQARELLLRVEGRLQAVESKMHFHICMCANATVLGPLTMALAHGKLALSLAVSLNDVSAEAYANRRIGLAYRYTVRDIEGAISHYEAASRLNHASGETRHEPMVLFELSLCYSYRRNWRRARELANKNIVLAHRSDILACGWQALGFALYIGAQDVDAQLAIETAINLTTSKDYVYGYGVHVRALLAARHGELQKAALDWLEARTVGRDQGHSRLEGLASYCAAAVCAIECNYDQALELSQLAVNLLSPMELEGAAIALSQCVKALRINDSASASSNLMRCIQKSLDCPDMFDVDALCDWAKNLCWRGSIPDLGPAIRAARTS